MNLYEYATTGDITKDSWIGSNCTTEEQFNILNDTLEGGNRNPINFRKHANEIDENEFRMACLFAYWMTGGTQP